MLGLLDGRTRPPRSRVDSIWIGADVGIRKQRNSVLVEPSTFMISGNQRTRRYHCSAAKSN
ncbi:MAG: hypothetical protein QNL51_08225 [Opitutaceae bacterium]